MNILDEKMARDCSKCSVKCSIVSVPSEYFYLTPSIETTKTTSVPVKFDLGSNTIIINERTSVRLGLNNRLKANIPWAMIKFNFCFSGVHAENDIFSSKRLVHIVTNQNITDNSVVITDDLLFNLGYSSSKTCFHSKARQSLKPYLVLTSECTDEVMNPIKATKVLLSLFQFEAFLEDSFIDKLLEIYFSVPRYLCCNDVFSVPINEYDSLGLTNIVHNDIVYFKVCELKGPQNENSDVDVTFGCLVDCSVTLYQVSNHQGFAPSRTIPRCYRSSLNALLSDELFIQHFETRTQNLLPSSFDELFRLLHSWMEPFLSSSSKTKELSPVFLLCGKKGSGKTILLHTLSQYLGMGFWRIDCATVGGSIPGQAEAKIKTIFEKLKILSPCILHLADIEALCQDSDGKDDVRITSCFEQHLRSLTSEWPIFIIATTHNSKVISPGINHLFLDSTVVPSLDCVQREDILLWLVRHRGESINPQVLQSVAAQTSGFFFRDLQVLVTLAFKEKFKRSKRENEENSEVVWSDFSTIIGLMHKAYSDSIGAPKVPSVSWKDVGGLEHLKKEILRSLRSNMFSTGLKRSGLLLHGPPGTGKTLLAKAVATQCGRNFLSVKGPELLNMYVGQSEHNVRDLFELAKAASPCIVFFDELDSLAPNRGRSGDSGGVMDRVVSQLLAEMDDLGETGDVFILGATNRPDLIDPALLRPGRLDKLLYVGPCKDRDSQLSVITALTRKLCLGLDVDLRKIVSQLPESVSGAQLSGLCSAAWLSSARQLIESEEHKSKSMVVIGQEHFHEAIVNVFNQH